VHMHGAGEPHARLYGLLRRRQHRETAWRSGDDGPPRYILRVFTLGI
jgi:hypothetical protein